MKRIHICGLLLLLPALALLLTSTFSVRAHADAVEPTGAYDYSVQSYEVDMEVAADRTVKVVERIQAYFTGMSAHGIVRSLPLEYGVSYRDIQAFCENSSDFSPYAEIEHSDDGSAFFSLFLRGESTVREQNRTYRLEYTMTVPPLKEEGYLSLDVIGYGMSTRLQNVKATVSLPEGLLESKLPDRPFGVSDSLSERTITITAEALTPYQGITLDLSFSEGVLTSRLDLTLLYVLGVGAGLLFLVFLVKILFCRQPIMTTTVNLSAPEDMDPLLMGKLIDNQVDKEDFGAAIFYFADQELLTIDLEDQSDPLLIKTDKPFPENAPEHLRTLYEGLFHGRTQVRTSELSNTFYRTAAAAEHAVKSAAGTVFAPRSYFLLGLMGVLTVLLLGGFAYLYTRFFLFSGYWEWGVALSSAISFSVAAFCSFTVTQKKERLKPIFRVLIVAAGCLVGLLPCLFLESACFGIWTFLLFSCFSALSGALSGSFLIRTEEYSKKLGQILGFKQFILYTERDKIEFMLKENPELYYHILPYAQVLGVTDAWTDKFKELSLNPPAYAYGYSYDIFDIMIFNSMFRSVSLNLARSMTSRPASSGGGSQHAGGFGGGFGGGGFGGGGMRGC